MKIKIKRFSLGLKILATISIFVLGSFAGWFYHQKTSSRVLSSQTEPQNKYLAFLSEVYDTIEKNYWKKTSEEELTNLFLKGTEKLIGQPQSLRSPRKENLINLWKNILNRIGDEGKKKEFSVKLADMVLANLEPFGRSRLYTQKEEKQLSQAVKNITNTDYYQALGIKKNASQKEVEKSYQEKKKELEKKAKKSPEAKNQLQTIEKAHQILSDKKAKQLYDQAGIEPTISYQLLSPTVLSLHFTKISPTSPQDLERVTEKFKGRKGLFSLIIDLRNNIGGSIDTLPYLLGPFIGNNQYAYQFFHQGETIDFKTKTGWLPGLIQYKRVVILINENTQSSAEVMASVLKKYNVGVLLGKKTKGWGTIEKVFPLKTQLVPGEKYSVFLVHSLTLREDGQPIQGNGVLPLIDTGKNNWQEELNRYFNSPDLIKAVGKLLNQS